MRVCLNQKTTAKSLSYAWIGAEALCARAIVTRSGPMGSQTVNRLSDRFLVEC